VVVGCDAEIASLFKYGQKVLKPLIFCHGLTACGKLYTGYCKELASWGMLVLAPDFLDESAGYTVNQNTQDEVLYNADHKFGDFPYR